MPDPSLPPRPADPSSTPDVSVVIVNWNTCKLLADCLCSLEAHTRGCTIEVIVVDNASTDGSAAMVAAEHPAVRWIASPTNVGFAAGCNLGMAVARGPNILLLNSDTVLREDAVSALLASLRANPDTSLVSCRLVYADGSAQPSCGDFPTVMGNIRAKFARRPKERDAIGQRFQYPFHSLARHQELHAVDWVAGAVMLFSRHGWEKVGNLDEKIFLFAEEWEWCLRFQRLGLKILHDPGPEVVHIGSGSWTLGPIELARARRAGIHAFFQSHYGRASAAGFVLLCAAAALLRTLAGLLQMLIPSRHARGLDALKFGLEGLRWAFSRSARRPLASTDLERSSSSGRTAVTSPRS